MALRDIKPKEQEFAFNAVKEIENSETDPIFIGLFKRGRLPESKSGKGVRRLVAVGKFRIVFIVGGKLRGNRISKHFHLFELVDITQTQKTKASITFSGAKGKKLKGYTLEAETVPELIRAIRSSYLRITCGFPHKFGFSLYCPSQFLLPVDSKYTDECGPCNGFIETYLAQCNLLGQDSVSKELIQFILDLNAAGITDLNLNSCPGLDPKTHLTQQLQPIISTLYHNTYFRTLEVEDISRRDAAAGLFQALRFNRTLTTISLRYLPSLPESSLVILRNALVNNDNHAIQIFDFSGTNIGSKGAEHISTALETMQHAFHSLLLPKCGILPPGIKALVMAFSKNFGMSLTIKVLDLSYNKFDEESSHLLEKWIEKCGKQGQLEKLILKECGNKLDLTSIAKPLRALPNIKEIDFSGNKLTDGTAQLIRVLVEDSSTIQTVRLTQCALGGHNVAGIILAMTSNPRLKNTHLYLGDNNVVDVDGEKIARALTESRNLYLLDLSQSKFKDASLVGILQALVLSHTPSIHTLILDRAIDSSWSSSASALKSKTKSDKPKKNKLNNSRKKKKIGRPLNVSPTECISSAILSVVNSRSCTLRNLSLQGPGWKNVILMLLPNLNSDCQLSELDLTGNNLTDSGAVAIAEMLRVNTVLQILSCDKNDINVTGWYAILASFMYNQTLRCLNYPWNDYEKAANNCSNDMAGERKKKKLRDTLLGIQQALESNSVAARGYLDVSKLLLKQNDDDDDSDSSGAVLPVPPVADVDSELAHFSKGVEAEGFKKSVKPTRAEKKLQAAQQAQNSPSASLKESTNGEKVVPQGVVHLEGLVNLMVGTGITKSWSVRYCVVETGVLNYYGSDQERKAGKKPKGHIDLVGAKVIPLSTPGLTKSAFGIEIHNSQKACYLQVEDKATMNHWLDILKSQADAEKEKKSEHDLIPTTQAIPPNLVSYLSSNIDNNNNNNNNINNNNSSYGDNDSEHEEENEEQEEKHEEISEKKKKKRNTTTRREGGADAGQVNIYDTVGKKNLASMFLNEETPPLPKRNKPAVPTIRAYVAPIKTGDMYGQEPTASHAVVDDGILSPRNNRKNGKIAEEDYDDASDSTDWESD